MGAPGTPPSYLPLVVFYIVSKFTKLWVLRGPLHNIFYWWYFTLFLSLPNYGCSGDPSIISSSGGILHCFLVYQTMGDQGAPS